MYRQLSEFWYLLIGMLLDGVILVARLQGNHNLRLNSSLPVSQVDVVMLQLRANMRELPSLGTEFPSASIACIQS